MDVLLYDEFYNIERTYWWSVGMRRMFHMLLRSALPQVSGVRLLDVGCGTGIAMEEFSRYGTIFGMDTAELTVMYTRRRNRARGVFRATLSELPVASGTLDVVLALDVVEHIKDDRAAVREIYRVLKPGGTALINVPAFPSLWSAKDEMNHHERRYTLPSLQQLLTTSGFAVERITYTNAGTFPAVWLLRRIQRRFRLGWNRSAEYHPRAWTNTGLRILLEWGGRALRYVNFPFGTSITSVVRR